MITPTTTTTTPSHAVRLEQVRRTYLRLGTGELAAAAVFAGVAARSIAPRLPHGTQWILWLALAPLVAVLVQAGVFWLLARAWVGVRPMPRGLALLYLGFGIVDAILLAIGLVALAGSEIALAARIAIGIIWLFALTEFVNYFVVRLAYPVSSWLAEVGRWRRPRLVADIREGLRGPRGR